MKPRRLHKLTIFSMRWLSVGALIVTADYTDPKSCRGVCAKRLCHWLFIAGEFESLPQRYAGNSQSPFGVFFHVADRFINVFIKHELLFARNSEKRQHVTTGE